MFLEKFAQVEDAIPESQLSGNTDIAILGAMLGFAIMMSLDVALGNTPPYRNFSLSTTSPDSSAPCVFSWTIVRVGRDFSLKILTG